MYQRSVFGHLETYSASIGLPSLVHRESRFAKKIRDKFIRQTPSRIKPSPTSPRGVTRSLRLRRGRRVCPLAGVLPNLNAQVGEGALREAGDCRCTGTPCFALHEIARTCAGVSIDTAEYAYQRIGCRLAGRCHGVVSLCPVW